MSAGIIQLKATSAAPEAPASFTPREYGLDKAAYDANETMFQIGCGRTMLYQLIARGELIPIKVGSKTLFTAPDIAAFLNRRRITKPSRPTGMA